MKTYKQKTNQKTKSNLNSGQTPLNAAWVFGLIILLFYMGVFFYAPSQLPVFKYKQLAIISALLSGLFIFFFMGTIEVDMQVESKWAKLGTQSTGGAAAFVFILWWWNNPDFS